MTTKPTLERFQVFQDANPPGIYLRWSDGMNAAVPFVTDPQALVDDPPMFEAFVKDMRAKIDRNEPHDS